MKTFIHLLVAGLFLTAGSAFAQQTDQTELADSTGLPGDNFSLQGALEMFKKAGNPEEFEKLLNAENNYVNNLDLDSDGQTDYINVIDNMENSVHAVVLQVQVSETESQDIAVIEIEKTGEETAILQIVGDEEIYGDSAIIEPVEVDDDGSKGGGPNPLVKSVKLVVVNVWFWPCVKHIYAPTYVVYVSPWKYRHYPNWWKPWKPYGWSVFYHRHKPYHIYYQPVFVYRVIVAHNFYRPHRKVSVIVINRYKPAHAYYHNHHPHPYYRQPAQNPNNKTPNNKTPNNKAPNKNLKAQPKTTQPKSNQGKGKRGPH